MKRKLSRVLALLLSLVMLLTLFPTAVFAAGEEEPAYTEEAAPAEDPVPVEEEAPAEEPAPVEEEAPAEEPAPVEEEVPAEEPAPVEEEAPAEEPAPVEEIPVEEPAPVEEEAPVEEPAPVEEIPVEEPVPEEAEPIEEEGTVPPVSVTFISEIEGLTVAVFDGEQQLESAGDSPLISFLPATTSTRPPRKAARARKTCPSL